MPGTGPALAEFRDLSSDGNSRNSHEFRPELVPEMPFRNYLPQRLTFDRTTMHEGEDEKQFSGEIPGIRSKRYQFLEFLNCRAVKSLSSSDSVH